MPGSSLNISTLVRGVQRGFTNCLCPLCHLGGAAGHCTGGANSAGPATAESLSARRGLGKEPEIDNPGDEQLRRSPDQGEYFL